MKRTLECNFHSFNFHISRRLSILYNIQGGTVKTELCSVSVSKVYDRSKAIFPYIDDNLVAITMDNFTIYFITKFILYNVWLK